MMHWLPERRGTPVKPWRHSGEIWSMGWDIPTKWCVDANGDAFVNSGHGGDPYIHCTTDYILQSADDDETRAEIAAKLGLEPPEPSWVALARAAGWTPPVKP